MAEVMEESTRLETEKLPAVPRRKSRAKWVILVVLVVLTVAGATAYVHFRDRISTDDAQVDSDITGIAPRVAGTVLQVLVKDNQAVKAGDLLVVIDPRDYEAKVNQAKAALTQAESQLTTARTIVPLT